MYSIDIFSMVSELSEKLEGEYLKKFYEISRGIFLMKFRESVVVDLRGYIFLGKLETPLQPTPFAMFVRKHVEDRKLMRVEQHEFERIIKMDFGYVKIIIELFGEGNLILVDENGTILMPYYSREFRHRTVRRGETYKFPPSLKNPLTLGAQELRELFKNEKKEIVRVLAKDLNLGGIYAEEICRRALVDKNTPAESVNWESICSAFTEIISEAKNHKGYIYENMASPIKFVEKEPTLSFESLSEAISKIYYNVEYRKEIFDEELAKLKKVLSTQEETLKKLIEEEEKYRRIGDLIYEKYGEIYEKIYNGEKMIILDGFDIYLDGKSVEEVAEKYYEMAKKVRSKIEGVKNAIDITLRKISERENVVKIEEEKTKRRKTFWFENYRWFITSSNLLVVAGKDAKTNDRVVKKYLGENDLYFHADIHGAPSVVLKTAGKNVDEKTLEEVAIFSVCFSKAWQNNLWGVSAYYVNASQVSKQAESGEYVPKGAWVIRGKKNYIHKIPLRLAVGIIEYQGVELIMCGPVSALEKIGKKYVVIEPGELSKEAIAKEISRILNWNDVEEIKRVLPTGNSKIVSLHTT